MLLQRLSQLEQIQTGNSKAGIDVNANASDLDGHNNSNSSNNKTPTRWSEKYCSTKEMQEILNTKTDEVDLDRYKQMIYKLIAYISKKQNLIFNQVLHNNYTQFTRIYGFDLNTLKAETKSKSALDAIYYTPLAREIFFNMLCTNTSTIH